MMKRMLPPMILLFCFSTLLTSCGGQDIDDLEEANYSTEIFTANITYSEMYGHWKLSKLEADTLVNLNNDETWNHNLLLETSCFDEMSITFNEDNTYSAVNARLDFHGGETNDQFVCMEPGAEPARGTWSIEGDILHLTITVDGQNYDHTKKLTYTGDSFSFQVERWESEEYVTDPGDTGASRINVIYSEYTRAQP